MSLLPCLMLGVYAALGWTAHRCTVVNMGEPLGCTVAVLGAAWAKQRPKASRPTQLLAERWCCQRRQEISSSLALNEQRGDATRRRSRNKVVASIENVEIGCDAHFSSVQEWITSVFLCSFEPLVCFAPFLILFSSFFWRPEEPSPLSSWVNISRKPRWAQASQSLCGSGRLGLAARVGCSGWLRVMGHLSLPWQSGWIRLPTSPCPFSSLAGTAGCTKCVVRICVECSYPRRYYKTI